MSIKKAGTRIMPRDFQELLKRVKTSETYDKEALRSEISDQIACLMEVQELTKAELARRLNKSRAYVTKILQGNANFTLDTLVQIARVLGCKYIPEFVPVNVWKQIEAKALNVSPQRAGEARLVAEAYPPATQRKNTANDPDSSKFTA